MYMYSTITNLVIGRMYVQNRCVTEISFSQPDRIEMLYYLKMSFFMRYSKSHLVLAIAQGLLKYMTIKR